MRCSAAWREIARAVAGPPVKVMWSTSEWLTSAAPASGPRPVTTLTTPSGKPASTSSDANSTTEAEATSLGLSTTVFPAASAGASLHVERRSGEFQGTSGCHDSYRLAEDVREHRREVHGRYPSVDLVSEAAVVPVPLGDRPHLTRVSRSSFPFSRVSSPANVSTWASTTSASRVSSSPRSLAVNLPQGPSNARRAAATARATSVSTGVRERRPCRAGRRARCSRSAARERVRRLSVDHHLEVLHALGHREGGHRMLCGDDGSIS